MSQKQDQMCSQMTQAVNTDDKYLSNMWIAKKKARGGKGSKKGK